MEPVLKVEDLTKVFSRSGQQDFTAVDHISFELMPGECLGIIGESGSQPKLLICDEATSSLDVTVQKEVLALLRELRGQQGTDLSILFICHDIALVQEFCDRVLVLYHGDIVEQGIPDDVIQNPQNEYTKRLIDSIL